MRQFQAQRKPGLAMLQRGASASGVGGQINQPIIDLSKFKQIRAIDLNAGTHQ